VKQWLGDGDGGGNNNSGSSGNNNGSGGGGNDDDTFRLGSPFAFSIIYIHTEFYTAFYVGI
jgi:hypothetical protein